MATSDRDEHEDREEKDEAAEGDHAEDKAESEPEGDEPGGDEADEERAAAEKKDEEKKAEEKPAPKAAAKRPGVARGARGPGAARAKAPPPKGGSLGKSMLLFVIIVGGLAAGFAILGREEAPGSVRPRWNKGQTVDVEITLVKNDKADLACSSGEEIEGKHCAFEANNKPWSKGDNNDDKKVFRPYTTTERMQFVAAGVWSDPALAPDKIPATRFSLKCKYHVDGTMKSLGVRWEQAGQWYPNQDWYAGSVSDCKIVP
jgi:hypothetical protein